jgi:hypothetical protein
MALAKATDGARCAGASDTLVSKDASGQSMPIGNHFNSHHNNGHPTIPDAVHGYMYILSRMGATS